METLIFLSPFALFFLILPLAYFQLNTWATSCTLLLIAWTIFVPLVALWVHDNKEKREKHGS